MGDTLQKVHFSQKVVFLRLVGGVTDFQFLHQEVPKWSKSTKNTRFCEKTQFLQGIAQMRFWGFWDLQNHPLGVRARRRCASRSGGTPRRGYRLAGDRAQRGSTPKRVILEVPKPPKSHLGNTLQKLRFFTKTCIFCRF